MSLVKDIKTILIDNGIDVPIYLSFLPEVDEPTIFALFQSGGKGRDKASGVEYPTFQLLAKSNDYEIAMTVIKQVETILHHIEETTVGGQVYMTFFQESNPTVITTDQAGNYTISVNFSCIVRSL